MNILSIEAAAAPASVALGLDGRIFERCCDDPRAQAENLLELVDELLGLHDRVLSDIDGFAVGRGPGSFTGLRVAAALTQGLAYSTGKPAANVSSLAAIAHLVMSGRMSAVSGDAPDSVVGHDPELTNYPILVCLDARKSQVYCALYEADEAGRPVRVSPETVQDPETVVAQFRDKTMVGVGNGFEQYAQLKALNLNTILNVNPSAGAVALRAASGVVPFDKPFLATPEYVRNNVTHGS